MDLATLVTLWDSLDWIGKTLVVFLGIHPLASAIVALTPTPKDDAILGKLYRIVIEPLALHIFKAKQPKIPMPGEILNMPKKGK